MLKLLGPQHAAWMPRSSCRAAPRPLIETSGEALTIGPMAGCGQAGQPCASAPTCALSPSRAAAGIFQNPPDFLVYHAVARPNRGKAAHPSESRCLPDLTARVIRDAPMWAIYTLHIVVSVFIIFVILLQPGKADGMAAFAGGGGGSNTAFGGRGSVTFLSKVTAWCAIIFMVTSLTLAWRSSHSDSVMRASRHIAAQNAAKKDSGSTQPAQPALPTGQTAPAPARDGAAVPVQNTQTPPPNAPAPAKK